jgi:TetR/AcrR family transcriptional regulator, cholesterol catabolism regulator
MARTAAADIRHAVPAVTRSGSSRDAVLDTAARLFRHRGYSATSLRDIAAACGMKAGSLYHHFASKDEIVGEVLRIGVELVFDDVRKAVMRLPATAPAAALIGTAVETHLKALLALQDYTSANLRIFADVPEATRKEHLQTRDAYEKFWAGLFTRCARSGAFDPKRSLRLARFFLIGAMNGSLEWFDHVRVPIETVASELTATMLYGLIGRPTTRLRNASSRPRKR